MKNKEFKVMLKEWNSFINEEDKAFDHNLKHDGEEIETIGDLKELLNKIKKYDESSDDERKKIKLKKGANLVKDLTDIGIDFVEISTGASIVKNVAKLAYSLYNLKDSDSDKIGDLKGFDIKDKLQKTIKDEVIISCLKDLIMQTAKYPDYTKLSDIDINKNLSKKVYKKIKKYLKQ